MSYFSVTSAQLRAKAQELSDQNSQVKAQIDALLQTETSLGSMWEGDAKTAFHNAFMKDKVQMDNFYTAISNYVTVLNSIAQKYEQAEAQNQEIASTRAY